MEMTIIASRTAYHQVQHALSLKAGLERNGISANVVGSGIEAAHSPIVACWGWRAGIKYREAGKQVLVLERGYIGDRFSWTSLGWNGLNAHAKMPIIDDGGNRFRKYHSSLLKDRDYSTNDYVLLIGQVPGDAALRGLNLSSWYQQMKEDCERIYSLPVRFRPHPRAPAGAYPKSLEQHTGDLADAMLNARAVVTFNSNTAVEAVLAGKSALSFDDGSMAREVTSHVLGDDYNGDRMDWAHKLAWKQWQLSEIEDGSAINYLLQVM